MYSWPSSDIFSQQVSSIIIIMCWWYFYKFIFVDFNNNVFEIIAQFERLFIVEVQILPDILTLKMLNVNFSILNVIGSTLLCCVGNCKCLHTIYNFFLYSIKFSKFKGKGKDWKLKKEVCDHWKSFSLFVRYVSLCFSIWFYCNA